MNPDPAPDGNLVLRDIHVPFADWWPPAPGWWIVAVLLVVGLYLLWRFGQILFTRRRRRQTVLAAYDDVRSSLLNSADATSVAKASEFLRQVALASYPREQVAGLSGDAWLSFLDATGGGEGFRNGPGSVIGHAAYRPDAGFDVDAEALADLIKHWITRQLRRVASRGAA